MGDCRVKIVVAKSLLDDEVHNIGNTDFSSTNGASSVSFVSMHSADTTGKIIVVAASNENEVVEIILSDFLN